MSPTLSTEMLTMSGLKSRVAVVAVGRSILMDWSLIMLRLAIMNEASRKNMMSISGMISMRAFLWGKGEPIFMGSGLLPEQLRFETPLLGRVDHHLDVGGGRLQIELQLRVLAGEIVEGNQGQDG